MSRQSKNGIIEVSVSNSNKNAWQSVLPNRRQRSLLESDRYPETAMTQRGCLERTDTQGTTATTDTQNTTVTTDTQDTVLSLGRDDAMKQSPLSKSRSEGSSDSLGTRLPHVPSRSDEVAGHINRDQRLPLQFVKKFPHYGSYTLSHWGKK